MSTRKQKLYAVKSRLVAYTTAEKARLQKEADWLRAVQKATGIGAVRALTEAAAEEALQAEIDGFLAA